MKDHVRRASLTKFKNTGIPRQKYLKTIQKQLGSTETIILNGVRKSGKSTIMMQLASKLKKAVYVNFDDYCLLEHLKAGLLNDVIREFPDMDYYFFDEIHKVPGFESWLRTHHGAKPRRKFIVSGSNLSMLSLKTGSALPGKSSVFEVFPLDYGEFRKFSRDSFEKYLIFGGFPEVVLEKDKEKKKKLLTQHFEKIILKGILEKHNLTPSIRLRAAAKYVVSNSGLMISANRLAKEAEVNSRTAEKYLSCMTDAYMTFEVPYFRYSKKTKYSARRSSKYYSIDNGLATALYGKADGIRLFQSVVAQTIRRKCPEIYHRGKHETDFIQNNASHDFNPEESAFEYALEHLSHFSFDSDAGKESFPEVIKPLRDAGNLKKIRAITPENLDEI